MAAAGKRTMTSPVARPTPPPSTPPTRVGVSCFLTILTLPSGLAFDDGGVIGVNEADLGVHRVHGVVVRQGVFNFSVHAGVGEERVDGHGESS